MVKMNGAFRKTRLVLAMTAVVASLGSGSVSAGANESMKLDVPSQSVGKTMVSLAKASGVQIVLSQEVSNNRTLAGLEGEYTLTSALDSLLAGTGLTYQFQTDKILLIKEEKGDSGSEVREEHEDVEEVVVTGSKLIKDPGKLTRQIEVFDREEIERSGVTRIEDFLARLPQNMNAPSNMGSGDYDSRTFGLGTNAFAGSGVNLRGLGSQYTLILIDGRRPSKGGQYGEISDISNIPVNQVERIEILFDGAAALYGADAVGGVINIITSREYDGTEVSVVYEETQRGGGQRANASIAKTFQWDSGSLTATLGYQGQKAITADSRPELNFINGQQYALPPSSPGNIGSTSDDRPLFYVADHNGDGDTLDDGERITGSVELPPHLPGQSTIFTHRSENPGEYLKPINGVEWQGITQAQLPQVAPGQSLSLYDIDTSGNVGAAVYLPGYGYSLTPEDESYSVRLRFNQDLSDDLRVGLNVSYSETEKYSSTNNTLQEYGVSIRNPDNIFQSDFTYSFVAPLPNQSQEVKQWDGSVSGGVEYDFNDDWVINVGFGYSVGDNKSDTHNKINSRLRDIIVGYKDLYWMDPPVEEYIHGVFDPYLGFESVEAMQAGLTDELVTTTNKTVSTDFDISAQGVVAELPAGDVRADISVGYRSLKTHSANENTSLYSDVIASTNGYYGYTSTWDRKYRSSTKSAGFQLVVPLVAESFEVPLMDELLFNLNARTEEYSNIKKRGQNWSAGFNWKMNDWLTTRVNWNHSLRVPAAVRYSGEPSLNRGQIFVWEEDRETMVDTLAGYTLTGGANHLRAEKNNGTALGFIITPTFLEGLDIQFNFTESKTEDQVSLPFMDRNWTRDEIDPANVLLNPVLQYMTPELAAQYGLNDSDWDAGTLIEDLRQFNVGDTTNRGADMSVRYSYTSDFGDWFVIWRHQYVHSNEVVRSGICPEDVCSEDYHSGSGSTPGTPFDSVGVIDRRVSGYSHYPLPEHGGSFEINWSYKGFGINASTLYSDETAIITSQKRSFWSDDTNVYKLITKPAQSLNMSFSYDFSSDLFDAPEWLRNTRIQLTVQDLWSREQSVNRVVLEQDFEPEPLSYLSNFYGLRARGRTFSLSVNSSF